MPNIIFNDLGKIEYGKAYEYQKEIFNKILLQKQHKQISDDDQLIFCEHPHVFTLGKSGKDNNLLVTEQWLQMSGVSYYKTDRGGDITYHGPGQIVGYPILDLEKYSLGIKEYINKMERAIIACLQSFSIESSPLDGATGVWLDIDKNPRKICAIGVRASRYVTMHGFALNVNTDLQYFEKIIPCGIPDKKVTSISAEIGKVISNHEVIPILKQCFSNEFGWDYAE